MNILLKGDIFMKVIATGLQKGGVGKTTMAISLAAELGKTAKVLLIDCDPQGNTTGALVSSYNYELADVLFKKCTIEDAIIKTGFDNLYLLPTVSLDENTQSLNQLRQYKTTMAANNPKAIKQMLKTVADKFDFCVIDTSPAFDPFEENIYEACDEVIAVMKLDTFSTDGLTIFDAQLKDFKERKECVNPKFSKIILNAQNKSISYHKQVIDKMSSQDAFDCFIVPQDQAFNRSQNVSKPVQYLNKDEGPAQKATLEALELIAEEVKRV